MSISFITGKPGGGKGLLAMQQIVDELRHSKRPIITNLAVRVQPWVNGRNEGMIGLKSYLLSRFGSDFEVEHRLFTIPDEETASFFLYRVVGVNGERHLEKAEAVTVPLKDGKVKIVEFKTKLGMEWGGVLYVIDEAWKFWPSRRWQETGEGLEFYGAQHRKFGDDVLICTQHTKQVDPAIHRVAQDFWVCKNHSKMSLGAFRQPDVFTVSIYDAPPNGSAQEPMSRKLHRLDKKGLGQTYDTSAGVGLVGQGAADTNARKKGLPWWVLLVVIVGLAFVGGQVHRWVAAGAARTMFGGKKKPDVKQSVSVVRAESVKVESVVSDAGKLALHAAVVTNEPLVWMTGYALVNGKMLFFLSDGSEFKVGDPEVQYWSRKYAIVNGKTNRMRPLWGPDSGSSDLLRSSGLRNYPLADR